MVLLELAAHLPDRRSKEAEQLALDAQTAKALITDWRKPRVAHLRAVTYARLGKFETAVALALTPHFPAGVPVLVAGLVAVAVGMRIPEPAR